MLRRLKVEVMAQPEFLYFTQHHTSFTYFIFS